MKHKIFGFALSVAALLSGCIKSDNSYKDLQPVLPGMLIYSNAASQNELSLLPASVGMRLAVLQSEAAKQGKEIASVTDAEGRQIQSLLFGVSVSKIESASADNTLAEGDYLLTFRPEEPFSGVFCLDGQILVRTGGRQLDAADAATWEVLPQPGFAVNVISQTSVQRIEITEGITRLSSRGEGSYEVSLQNLRANFKDSACASDWSGSFTLRTEAASLAYSDCHGKKFTAEGSFGGDTLFSFTMTETPTRMSYTLANGTYLNGGPNFTGRVTCRLTGMLDYPMADYPSPTVEVEWSLDSNNNLSRVITYNGYVYSK